MLNRYIRTRSSLPATSLQRYLWCSRDGRHDGLSELRLAHAAHNSDQPPAGLPVPGHRTAHKSMELPVLGQILWPYLLCSCGAFLLSETHPSGGLLLSACRNQCKTCVCSLQETEQLVSLAFAAADNYGNCSVEVEALSSSSYPAEAVPKQLRGLEQQLNHQLQVRE